MTTRTFVGLCKITAAVLFWGGLLWLAKLQGWKTAVALFAILLGTFLQIASNNVHDKPTSKT